MQLPALRRSVPVSPAFVVLVLALAAAVALIAIGLVPLLQQAAEPASGSPPAPPVIPPWLTAIAGLALLIGAPLWWMHQQLVARPEQEIDEITREAATIPDLKERLAARRELLELRNTHRETAIHSIGSLLQAFTVLAVLGGLFFTWRQLQMTDHTSQRTMDLSRESQDTDTYNKAIELLGNPQSDTRQGALRALDSVARSSNRHYWAVMGTFTSYVRARREYKEGADPSDPADDVGTALRLLGTRRTTDVPTFSGQPIHPIDLKFVDLRGADLTGFNLDHVYLWHAYLQKAHLPGADLTGAFLNDAVLQRADLRGAKLKDAQLARADLESADFGLLDDKPTAASLHNANLQNANLTHAVFRCAHLEGADLSTATGLTGDQLKDAFMDSRTKLPAALGSVAGAGPTSCPKDAK